MRIFPEVSIPQRLAAVLVVMALLFWPLVATAAETSRRDPEFAALPFDQWVSEGEHTGIAGWSADILPAEISIHQRLMLRVVIRLNGRLLEKRRSSGRFVTLVEYRDRNNEIWQNHTSLDLTKLLPGIETQQLAFAQYAFVLPGDYSLAISVCDSASLEHNMIFRQVHADSLESDPLPDAWAGLPAVEFIPAITEPPDVWYLPGIEHRLNLSLPTRRRVHIQLLVNTTPSAGSAGSISASEANMSAVIPSLKVLSQIDVPNGSVDVAFLDLAHRRVTFEQKNVNSLAWENLRRIFLDPKPGMIDVRDLEGQSKMRQFFRDEVGRRLNAGEPPGGDAVFQVVIVLSCAGFLPDQEPLSLPEPPRDPDRLLFYIRFGRSPVPAPRKGSRQTAAALTPPPMPVDDLERAVEPLNAQLYEATSEEEFRKILAAVIARISGT